MTVAIHYGLELKFLREKKHVHLMIGKTEHLLHQINERIILGRA